MGPRSRERGEHSADECEDAPKTASMGPRSRERGEAASAWVVLLAYLLQWGRARGSAERVSARPPGCAS